MPMRFTVIDADGAISFCGPGHGLKMLAAACSSDAQSYAQVIAGLEPLDRNFADAVRNGLCRFDEHCLRNDPATVDRWIEERADLSGDAFRVLNEATRQASLHPERLGLVLFNLHCRRIVQVQNSYGALKRCDRGRVRQADRPTQTFYRYSLPDDWQIVP